MTAAELSMPLTWALAILTLTLAPSWIRRHHQAAIRYQHTQPHPALYDWQRHPDTRWLHPAITVRRIT